MNELSRRQFLRIGALGTAMLPLAGCASTGGAGRRVLRLGLIADLHHGLDPRAAPRLEEFLIAAEAHSADGIVQLGDFNYGKASDRPCMGLWNQFRGDRFHVLGNHDLDVKTKDEMLEFWSMPARHYSFDRGGHHFVVLDRNNLKTDSGYVGYARGNYYVAAAMRGHADPEQLEWLRADLLATELPTVVFVHQGLGVADGLHPLGESAAAVESVLETANSLGANVVACFCGHHHLDRYRLKNGIHYVWINSASYYWVGADYGRMAPYREPLFAFLTFRDDGWLELEGRRTSWEEPSPATRGHPEAERLTPLISDRHLAVRNSVPNPRSS